MMLGGLSDQPMLFAGHPDIESAGVRLRGFQPALSAYFEVTEEIIQFHRTHRSLPLLRLLLMRPIGMTLSNELVP